MSINRAPEPPTTIGAAQAMDGVLEAVEERPDVEKEEERQTETEPAEVDEALERFKVVVTVFVTLGIWIGIFAFIHASSSDFVEPKCSRLDASERAKFRSCDRCGGGTLLLPIFGEYENSWSKGSRAVLYLAGTLCIFMGVGIVCDQFVAAIEEITSSEWVVWREVHNGSRRKFRVKVWNGTVANITLMALGSSAPEILLSATELIGRGFFAGDIGPLTIVGSAAFNLFVISAACVAAIPAPDTKMIEGMDAFMVTATVSLLAYIWILVVLLGFSPDRVEIWEAIVTLAFFPALVMLAFAADKGWLRSLVVQKTVDDEESEVATKQKNAVAQYGKELPLDTLRLLEAAKTSYKPNTRAQFRKAATGMLTGSMSSAALTLTTKKSTDAFAVSVIGFADARPVVLECAEYLTLKVLATRPPDTPVTLKYFTREGTAKQDLRYRHVEGEIVFGPGILDRTIEVPIIDDNLWQPEEEFYVELVDAIGPESNAQPGIENRRQSAKRTSQQDLMYKLGQRTCTVTVLNDDIPGTLAFDTDEVFTREGATATLGVVRTKGWCGDITCIYETQDDSATADKDYVATKGTLKFADGESHRTIDVQILPSDDRPQERFKLILKDAEPAGVLFDSNTDGGETGAVCDVVIAAKGDASPFLKLLRICFNYDRWEVAQELWMDQARELLYCGGSPEDQVEASFFSWVCHVMSLLWKIVFLIIPPPLLGGGWPCFAIALLMIGVVTALAGDIASLLGCCLGIPDHITAITLVALGTSLPDTFASRTAAQHDDTADNAVGNVTGSNSVNVFLGSGISWLIGSVYWSLEGKTDEWSARYPTIPFGFAMPTNTLAFSVAVYVVCSFACLSLLAYRRITYGGELGGPQNAQYRDAALLFSLWVAFLIATSLHSVLADS